MSPEDPNSYLFSMDNFEGPYYWGMSDLFGYTFIVDSVDLIKYGFYSQEKIYCQAFMSNLKIFLHPENPVSHLTDLVLGPSYIDIATNKRVYTGFGDNHSEVKSFILP